MGSQYNARQEQARLEMQVRMGRIRRQIAEVRR